MPATKTQKIRTAKEANLQMPELQESDLQEPDTQALSPDVEVIGAVPVGTKQKVLKPVKRERSKSEKGHYVSNAQLLEEFYVCKVDGKLSNKMAKYLMLVAERYSFHPWFVGWSFREDMVATAVVNLCANWHKFNPEKQEIPNPFSYYTTACYRSFLSYLDSERKERDIRDQLLVEAGANPSFNFQSRGGISGKTSDDTAFMGGGEE